MNRPIESAPQTRTVVALQCIACGHVEAPAENLFRCLRCNGLDTRPFVADVLEDQEEAETLDIRSFIR